VKYQNKVSLFILGAAKCGTTTLHHYLNRQPSILMSNPKEPLFFEAEYERGGEYYLEKYYGNRSNEIILGEARHRNLYLPFVAPRIEEYAPNDVKFIVILRNPVDRAYSHWLHWSSRGVEKRDFTQAIEENILMLEKGIIQEIINDPVKYKKTLDEKTGNSTVPSYVDSGYYGIQVNRYQKIFGKNKLLVVLLEELIQKPSLIEKKLGEFLGLDMTGNIEGQVKNEAITYVGHKAISILRSIPGKNYIPANIRQKVFHRLIKHYSIGKEVPDSVSRTKDDLKSHYKKYNEELEKIIGKDIDIWN